jgi:purine-nucleoside phosphorylase
MSDEMRSEIDRLEKLAQEANAAKRYGDAMKHLTHAMTICAVSNGLLHARWQRH